MVYKDDLYNMIDGLKIDFLDFWVYLCKLNIEFIIRIYVEGVIEMEVVDLVNVIKGEV